MEGEVLNIQMSPDVGKPTVVRPAKIHISLRIYVV